MSEQEQRAIDRAVGALGGAVAVGLCKRPPDTPTQALGRFPRNRQMTLPAWYTAFEVFNGSSNVNDANCAKVAELTLEFLAREGVTGVTITAVSEPEPGFKVDRAE